MTAPVRGTRFIHARRGVECIVTRVDKVKIGYTTADHKGGGTFPPSAWAQHKVVK